ncbi:hypothetical protein ACFWDA_04720 [Rhodococcus zopfii]
MTRTPTGLRVVELAGIAPGPEVPTEREMSTSTESWDRSCPA